MTIFLILSGVFFSLSSFGLLVGFDRAIDGDFSTLLTVLLIFVVPAIVFLRLYSKTKKKNATAKNADSPTKTLEKSENNMTVVESKETLAPISKAINYQNETSKNMIVIPSEMRKKTTLAGVLYYDKIEILENKVIGYRDEKPAMTWYFRNYSGVDFVKANLNSQFAQIVFLTGINSKNRAIGLDFNATQNANAIKDTNRILICSGMYSFDSTNKFAETIVDTVRDAFDRYNDSVDETVAPAIASNSGADEIKKFKDLLDSGAITQEEYEAKKKQLLGL